MKTATGRETGEGLDRGTLLIAGVVIVGAVMSILDATVVNVALDTLSKELGAPLPTIQWVVSGYTLALASVIPISGWLSDRYGARRVWLCAVVVFTAGSVLCATAGSATELIVYRCVQGVGGGILTPVGTTLIAKAAGPARMGRVMSLMGVPLVLGPVLGPVVGGVLLQYAAWEWIFLINVPIGTAALALGWRLLPRDTGTTGTRLDIAGLLLLSPGLALLIFGVSSIRGPADLSSGPTVLSLVAAILLISLFVLRSLRVQAPLVDLRLFVGRTFSAAAVTTFALGTATFGSTLLIPLYFQQVRGESVLITGMLTTPQALGMGIAISISGKLADRVGAGWVVPTGVLLAGGALAAFTTLSSTTPFWLTSLFLLLLGLGLGSSMMPAMSAAYASLSDSAAVSRATTELQVVQRVGSTIGIALFAVLLAQQITARGGAQQGTESLASAFADTFWWGVGLSVLALVPALFLPRRDLGIRHQLHIHHPLAGNCSRDIARHSPSERDQASLQRDRSGPDDI